MQKGVLKNELIDDLYKITEANIEFVQKKCVHLGENQLVWRSSQNAWNIREVLSHLLSYSDFYHKLFAYKIRKTKFKSENGTFVSSPLGRSAWRSMKLGRANNIKRKFQATRKYNPTTSPELLNNEAVPHFIDSQTNLLHILDMARKVNLKKIKVQMSISKVIRLRLGDALLFVVYHNERHIQQIKNILSHPNFPKKK